LTAILKACSVLHQCERKAHCLCGSHHAFSIDICPRSARMLFSVLCITVEMANAWASATIMCSNKKFSVSTSEVDGLLGG
jgi:hypothetical protein